MRQLSNHTLGLKSQGDIPLGKLKHLEIPVEGLDCMACSMALYEIVSRIEGVEQARASFKDGRVDVWIDPDKTDLAILKETLEKRGVK